MSNQNMTYSSYQGRDMKSHIGYRMEVSKLHLMQKKCLESEANKYTEKSDIFGLALEYSLHIFFLF